MADTALAPRVIDISNFDKAQLKVWAQQKDKDRVVGLLSGTGGGLKDILIAGMKSPVIQLVGGVALINLLSAIKTYERDGRQYWLMNDYEASNLFALLMASGVIKAISPGGD